MNNQKTVHSWITLCFYAFIIILTAGFFHSYTRTSSDRIYLTPMFDDDCGWEIYTMDEGIKQDLTPRQLSEHTGSTVYLSRIMPKELEQAGVTILELSGSEFWQFSVFLDGELLYAIDPAPDNRIGYVVFGEKHEGLAGKGEYIRCTLPPGYGGKNLTIAAFGSSDRLGRSPMPMIRLSGEAIISGITVASANSMGMPAAAYAALALFLLGLFLYSLLQGGNNWSLLLLMGAAAAQSLYYLRNFEMYFSSPYSLDRPAAYFLPTLFVCLPMLFLLFHMKKRRRFCAPFVLISIALSLVPPIANMLPQPPSFSHTPFEEALYIGILALLVFSVLEARDKNNMFRLFLSGLGLAVGSILFFSLCSLMKSGFYAGYMTTVIEHTFRHMPQLPLYWCGTILFLLCAGVSTIMMINNLVEERQRLFHAQVEKNVMEAQLVSQKEYYEAKLSNEWEIYRLKHDMQGHLNTTASLLTEGNIKEALEYLEKLTELHQSSQAELVCANPYISAVVSIFMERFKENGISFEHSIRIGKTSLPGPSLCLILNNALQNAQEAVLKLPEEQRTVSLQMAVRQSQLLIRVSNRFCGTLHKENGLPVTTKTEQGHGYGLTSVRIAIEQLGGDISFNTKDNRFELNIAIPENQVASTYAETHT